MAHARASLLRSTGCHEPVAGRLFERSLPGTDVFPDGVIFPKAPLDRPPGAFMYRLRREVPSPQVEVVARRPNRIVEILEVGYEEYRRRHALPPHVREAAQATQELLADAERVGVQVGIVAALHTWDDRVRRHPHLHCLVTGGGLTPDEIWKDSSKPGDMPFLVRVEPLMQRFRTLFCRKAEHAVKNSQLTLPKGCRRQQMLNRIHQVNRRDWQVYIAKPPEDGGPTTEEILAYQAKAVAGGPLSNVRIEGLARKVTAWQAEIQTFQEPHLRYVSESPLTESRIQEVSHQEVSFRWGRYDQASGRRVREQTETLPIETFLRRLFWHVPPPNLHTVRHYGLYSTPKKAQCEQCRALLPTTPLADAERIGTIVQEMNAEGRLPLEEFMAQRSRCPVCGKPLEITRVLPSSVTGKLSPRDKAFARKLSRTRRRRRGG